MAILKKYRNFEDLKSSKNLRIDNPLNSKALMKEFQDFISTLRSSVKPVKQSGNRITSNEQQSKR